MTQQEQHETFVPVIGQRDGRHDDDDARAVGTAHAPYDEDRDELRDGDRDEDGETYPAATYASGSADPDVADRDDVEVVDREEALAREGETLHTDSQDYDSQDARAVDPDEVDAAYDNAVRENEVRDVEASDADASNVEASDVEAADAEEDEVAATEAQEDQEWAAEHATAVEEEPTAVEEEPTAVEQEPAVVDSTPGSVDVAAVGAVWTDGAVDGLRERWRELQLRFIDDPRAVAGEADALVGEAVDTITNALQAQRAELANWQSEQGDDTERLRAAVRGYRDYLDRLLGM
ncbi:hypothetical protein [Dactylosporangium sp. NPDC051541]|uniref:hypothetical protein n=1 Tax=Dactylosporangium sp. NPDC051541 TaxID=3363977 RepID=UPI0037A0B366